MALLPLALALVKGLTKIGGLKLEHFGLLRVERLLILRLLLEMVIAADCLRNARNAKTAVTTAKTARTTVATAVACAAAMRDMGEAYARVLRSDRSQGIRFGHDRRALGAVMAEDESLLDPLRRHLKRRRLADRQFREQVRAQNIDSVNKLAGLSDAELIATNPAIPSESHQMEMSRRLKAAIGELTAETIAARKSADRASARIVWGTVALIVLTAALVALTVVLAVRP